MKGHFLVNSHADPAESNIYANRSALVLDWLLREGIKREGFSLREVAKESGVSLGLVQRVFSALVLKGLLKTEGVRTAKIFFLKKTKLLLENWLKNYNLLKKCKMRNYRSSLSGKREFLDALEQSKLKEKVVLALHSAAEAHGCKNTNLTTFELYMLDPSVRAQLEKALELTPQEKGYEVLLIEPYYKSLLNLSNGVDKGMKICPILLAFLDLYHFPLRGQEQAEFIAKRVPELQLIYKNRELP